MVTIKHNTAASRTAPQASKSKLSAKKTIETMEELATRYAGKLVPFGQGETTEATIIQKTKSHLLADVAGVALGIIPEREFSYDTDEIQPGDKVLAYVLLMENDDGQVILSLKRADKERVWRTLEERYKKEETLKVKVSAANRGGLLIEFGGIDGFIPVSQLAPIHYPKVEGGDTNKILSRLKKLVGETILVKVLSLDPKTNKLIFSEKAASNERLIKASKQLKIGSRLTAQITGIVDFGIFVKIDVIDSTGKKDKIDGLIHISEISWDKQENWRTKYRVGQKIDVAVVSTQGGKISLSIKRLQIDPWEKAAREYQVGRAVKAEVTRLTPFGAFVKLDKHLDALVHISEIPKDKLAEMEEGKKYQFFVLKIDLEARRINLTMKKPSSKSESLKKISSDKKVGKIAKNQVNSSSNQKAAQPALKQTKTKKTTSRNSAKQLSKSKRA